MLYLYIYLYNGTQVKKLIAFWNVKPRNLIDVYLPNYTASYRHGSENSTCTLRRLAYVEAIYFMDKCHVRRTSVRLI